MRTGWGRVRAKSERVLSGALWQPWGKQTGVEVNGQETRAEVILAGDEEQVASGRVYWMLD